MSFSASGTMNFNMDFKVGDKVACLNVNGDEGLSCSMDDYRVVIKEGQGFILEMPGVYNYLSNDLNQHVSVDKKVSIHQIDNTSRINFKSCNLIP